jgi:hypothetical protein
LSERKDASPSVGFDLVLMDTPKEADVVLPNRLVVATLTELADLAVIVQDQHW